MSETVYTTTTLGEIQPLLQAKNVTVQARSRRGVTSERVVVRDVSLTLHRRAAIGIAGESGSGKTALVHALFGYARTGLISTSGTVAFQSNRLGLNRVDNLARVRGNASRNFRGRLMGLVPQSTSSILDPVMRVGEQLEEVFLASGLGEKVAARRRAETLLTDVGFEDAGRVMARFPHQLSGGQRQRVVLAMALIADPEILVLDEGTTDLDVVTQARIIGLIQRFKAERELALIAVSHDLRVLAELCTELTVIYRGRVVECGPISELLAAPSHPYTVSLVRRFQEGPLQAIPIEKGVVARPKPSAVSDSSCAYLAHCSLARERCVQEPPLILLEGERRSRCWFHLEARSVLANRRTLGNGDVRKSGQTFDRPRVAGPTLRIAGMFASHLEPGLLSRRRFAVLKDINLTLEPGECLGVVGESGSGKTTLARILVGLHHIDRGLATYGHHSLAHAASRRPLELRTALQIIFQNPDTAFNPRRDVGDVLARRIRIFEGLSGARAARRREEVLDSVGLPFEYLTRRPAQLSGGEKQRFAIARALIGNPRTLICDEVVSSLDVETQARVLQVLKNLQREKGLAFIFISHDISVVAAVADRIAVFKSGEITEVGGTGDIIAGGREAYTKALVEAAFIGRSTTALAGLARNK